MNRARTAGIAVIAVAFALVITAWSTRPHNPSGRGLRPLLASSFDGPAPWGFSTVTGTAHTTTAWSHGGDRSLDASAQPGDPAYVRAQLHPRGPVWGRFWLRVAHRPSAGATVVMAVTGPASGIYLKLQADGRLALVAQGGTVLGRTGAALRSGSWYLIGWTWPDPLVRVVSESGIELARLTGAPQSGDATTLKLGIADRLAQRRAVGIDSVEVWPAG
jgi:hypothetical protein